MEVDSSIDHFQQLRKQKNKEIGFEKLYFSFFFLFSDCTFLEKINKLISFNDALFDLLHTICKIIFFIIFIIFVFQVCIAKKKKKIMNINHPQKFLPKVEEKGPFNHLPLLDEWNLIFENDNLERVQKLFHILRSRQKRVKKLNPTFKHHTYILSFFSFFV